MGWVSGVVQLLDGFDIGLVQAAHDGVRYTIHNNFVEVIDNRTMVIAIVIDLIDGPIIVSVVTELDTSKNRLRLPINPCFCPGQPCCSGGFWRCPVGVLNPRKHSTKERKFILNSLKNCDTIGN